MNLRHCTPESVGVPSGAIVDMLDELYRCGIEMHGFMLLRHGQVCAQGSWAPYNPETPHIMFSFSKSLTSTAIGFAVQEGIVSLDERRHLPGAVSGEPQREPAEMPGPPCADDGLRPRDGD